MTIKVNTNETDITVYDKANLNHATGVDVIPLVSVIRGEFKDIIFNIIADSLKLNDNERLLYKVINDFLANPNNSYNNINIDHIIRWLAKDTNMSSITYKRAAEILLVKGVIKYIDDQRSVAIINSFNIGLVTNVAKYIVIEVKPCVDKS